jgi:hypothetical protein
MPSGILTRCIVITHHLIERGLYWRNGTILTREGNRGLIISDPFQKKIQIWISGPSRKDLLSIVREKIDYVHKTLNQPRVRQMVKCICTECIDAQTPYFYDYETLRSFHTKGKSKVACSHSAEDVSIELLLGGIGDVVLNSEAEVLGLLRSLKARYDDEERVLEQANKIIQLQPNFMGMGVNLNALIKEAVLERRGQAEGLARTSVARTLDDDTLFHPRADSATCRAVGTAAPVNVSTVFWAAETSPGSAARVECCRFQP